MVIATLLIGVRVVGESVRSVGLDEHAVRIDLLRFHLFICLLLACLLLLVSVVDLFDLSEIGNLILVFITFQKHVVERVC